MKRILFFDADDLFKNYIQQHPLTVPDYDIYEESLNAIDINKISSLNNVEIISLFVHSEMIDTSKLDLFPNLKMIATRSTGFNHIDLTYCQNRNITVCNVPRYGETTVAEFAFGLLLALSRKIIQGRNAMTHNHINTEQYIGFDLQGKTIGIIGTGSIGQHMIQIAQGFGMNIIAFDIYPNPKLKPFYVYHLEDIYRHADIISLHVPSTPQNFHMIDQEAFEKMKKGVILINTARGDLIDTQSLYWALQQGIVGGAGLDVLENEDFLLHDEVITTNRIHDNAFLLDSAMNLKILQFKNVIVTPHIAFNSIDAINRINQTTLDNILNFQKGIIINNVS